MSYLYSIGLMSGTSMDSIDATIIRTNGIKTESLGINISREYSQTSKNLLSKIITNPKLMLKDKYLINQINKNITLDHKKVIDLIIKKSRLVPDLIGFHGQTIYHNAHKKISIQLGDGALLSKLLKVKVISEFRKNDILNGGQGAPIAPIYHKALMIKHGFELPCCFLNIGGVANISFWDGQKLIGFDTGPGNGLIDTYTKDKLNLNFDNNGHLASLGSPNHLLINDLMKNTFFQNSGPKSLDKYSFISILNNKHFKNLEPNNAISTLSEFTITSIQKSIFQLPTFPKIIVVMGGGQNNLYIVENLQKRLNCEVTTADKLNLNGQFIEAELIAYLAVRRIKNLPITFPLTTGVKQSLTGGEVNNYKT